jgi:hypothetical protein
MTHLWATIRGISFPVTSALSSLSQLVSILPVIERARYRDVTGNEIPRIVAHRCVMEASIGRHIVQTIEIEAPPSWGVIKSRTSVHSISILDARATTMQIKGKDCV